MRERERLSLIVHVHLSSFVVVDKIEVNKRSKRFAKNKIKRDPNAELINSLPNKHSLSPNKPPSPHPWSIAPIAVMDAFFFSKISKSLENNWFQRPMPTHHLCDQNKV
jgi:hypothetical protein